MSTTGSSWPPAVRDWVARCLSQMSDINKEAASAELKKIISTAYSNNTLWSTDWAKVQLESLKPAPAPQLKRKLNETDQISTKLKTSHIAPAYNSDAALELRAKRFRREHEIERQKAANPGLATTKISRHVNAPSSDTKTGGKGTLAPGASAYHSRRKFLDSSSGGDAVYDANVLDWDRFTIVGKSQSLFKNYLRLTSAPDPAEIRPLEVLHKTLEELSLKWKEKQDYLWTCDQFKSLRQDLTVQRIKNPFTVQVYEIHARMALESSDLVEFNQCLATLRTLYDHHELPGRQDEFMAYRILYLVYTRSRRDLNLLLSTLTPQQKTQPDIRHALDVQTALATSNYHAFFELFLKAPNMGGYILDHMIERERVSALVMMTKAYLKLPISYIASELAFEDDVEAVMEFLKLNQADFIVVGSGSNGSVGSRILECKLAHPVLVECLLKKHARFGIKGQI